MADRRNPALTVRHRIRCRALPFHRARCRVDLRDFAVVGLLALLDQTADVLMNISLTLSCRFRAVDRRDRVVVGLLALQNLGIDVARDAEHGRFVVDHSVRPGVLLHGSAPIRHQAHVATQLLLGHLDGLFQRRRDLRRGLHRRARVGLHRVQLGLEGLQLFKLVLDIDIQIPSLRCVLEFPEGLADLHDRRVQILGQLLSRLHLVLPGHDIGAVVVFLELGRRLFLGGLPGGLELTPGKLLFLIQRAQPRLGPRDLSLDRLLVASQRPCRGRRAAHGPDIPVRPLGHLTPRLVDGCFQSLDRVFKLPCVLEKLAVIQPSIDDYSAVAHTCRHGITRLKSLSACPSPPVPGRSASASAGRWTDCYSRIPVRSSRASCPGPACRAGSARCCTRCRGSP